MSDDLVERLRDFDPHLHEWEVVDEAADRIEALTAERDRAYAIGYSDAETEISTSALGQKNAFLHSQYAKAADRIEYLTADNTQLREALKACIASIEHANMSDGVCCCGDEMENHESPMFCGHSPVDMGEYHASLALKKARAALKEENYD
jgi:hypothetical protein